MKEFLSNVEPYSSFDFTVSIILVVLSFVVLFSFLKFVRFITLERIIKGGGLFFTHNGKPLDLPPKEVRHKLNEEFKILNR